MLKNFFKYCSGCVHNGKCESFIVRGKIEDARIVICKGLQRAARPGSDLKKRPAEKGDLKEFKYLSGASGNHI